MIKPWVEKLQMVSIHFQSEELPTKDSCTIHGSELGEKLRHLSDMAATFSPHRCLTSIVVSVRHSLSVRMEGTCWLPVTRWWRYGTTTWHLTSTSRCVLQNCGFKSGLLQTRFTAWGPGNKSLKYRYRQTLHEGLRMSLNCVWGPGNESQTFYFSVGVYWTLRAHRPCWVISGQLQSHQLWRCHLHLGLHG